MSSAGPWSVKGIDPKAREIAKDLARRSGMTLGEWLNQMIIDGEAELPPPMPEPTRRLQAGPQNRPEPRRSHDESHHAHDDAELTRVTEALETFSARLEAAEHRSTLAISGIDQSVMGVLSQLDSLERDQTSVAARFDGALEEVRETQVKLAERIRRMEQEETPRVEAVKALENALAKVAAQIYEAESRSRTSAGELAEDLSGLSRRLDRLDAQVSARQAETPDLVETVVARISERLDQAESRTSAAVRALESSFAGLDARLRTAENRLDPEAQAEAPERRFERLAVELSDKVEASRTELADHLRAAADGKLDRMEAAIRDLTGHVEAAERRSAQAIDRMGREVVRIAQSLGQRVSTVEARNAQAVEHFGGEMARIADVVENRMRAGETAQAAALERLGGEIGKIAERLAERIAASERRSAQAIDEVGDQVARVTDKINQRYERTSGELTQRIRESEERTAKLLEEARETLDRRLAESQRRSLIETADRMSEARPAPAYERPAAAFERPAPAPMDDFDPSVFAPAAFAPSEPPAMADPFAADPFAAALRRSTAEPFADDPFAVEETEAEIELTAEHAPTPAVAHEPEQAPEPIQAAQVQASPIQASETPPPFVEAPPAEMEEEEEHAFEAEPLDIYAPPPPAAEPYPEYPAEPVPRASTRDLIEAARAAARQAAVGDIRGRGRPDELFSSEPKPASRGFGGFRLGKRKKKESGTTLTTILLASATAATLTVTAVGYGMLSARQANEAADAGAHDLPPAPLAAAPAASDADLLASALTPAPETLSPGSARPEALAPELVAPEGADSLAASRTPRLTSRPAPNTPQPAATPATAPTAPPPAPTTPQALYTSAVRQIESGDNTGLEALRRAANLGHAGAQFYLAKVYETGSNGVKKDPMEARRWTERAAAGGDAKAMHNLGLYYFEGTGGAKNTTAAAGWFRKAAESGLQDSQYNLARLYEQGYGVSQNSAEAYKWYLIAADNGDSEAKTSAERLRARLSPESQAAAQRSAASFRPQSAALAEAR